MNILREYAQEGCGYVAFANAIFKEYEGREAEFEKKFGFPMKDENGDLNLYASRYLGEKEGELQLEEITNEKEWDLLEDALEEAKKGMEE